MMYDIPIVQLTLSHDQAFSLRSLVKSKLEDEYKIIKEIKKKYGEGSTTCKKIIKTNASQRRDLLYILAMLNNLLCNVGPEIYEQEEDVDNEE